MRFPDPLRKFDSPFRIKKSDIRICFFCGPKGNRTPHLSHAMRTLYQMSYGPLHSLTLLNQENIFKFFCKHFNVVVVFCAHPHFFSAFFAYMENAPAARFLFYIFRPHHSPALRLPVPGVYIYMHSPQTRGAVICVPVSRDARSATGAHEIFFIALEFFFHIRVGDRGLEPLAFTMSM